MATTGDPPLPISIIPSQEVVDPIPATEPSLPTAPPAEELLTTEVVENPPIQAPTAAAAAKEVETPPVEPSSTISEAEPALPGTAVVNQDSVAPEESQGREPPPLPEVEDMIEESFYFKDLKGSQKKALLELKAKIQAAIMDNTFLDPPKPAKNKKQDLQEENPKEEAEECEKKEEKQEQDGRDAIKPLTEATATEAPPSDEQTATTNEMTKSTRDVTPEPTTASDVILETTEDTPPEPTPGEDHDQPPADDESPSLDDLALWGIPLLHSKGDERTDVLLLKFLRARDFKVEKALHMLQDTMEWRKEFNTDGLIEEELPADFHGSFIHGVDREGHPVCYNGDLSSKKSVEDEAQLKKRIQVLEKGIQSLDFSPNGVHSMVQVIDFWGHSPAFLGRGVRSKILDLLQNNYPELVSKQIFINVPWYFPPLLSLFNARTRSKVVLAKPGRVAETLFKYISPDQVPMQYGGLSRLHDVQFTGTEAPVTQLILKAGEKQSIELPLPNAGKLVWDISVNGWDVLYGEEFVPDEGYIKIIRKTGRIATNEEPLRNTYVADEPGKMVLTIDNTASRRKRLLVYRYAVAAS